MTDCPPRLRGDLSKWLLEISTGVYVGQLTGRVRDAVWARVCKNLKGGRAVMVYNTNNEQHMDFRVHNTSWEPVDFDGLWLIRRPLPAAQVADDGIKNGFSKAARYRMADKAGIRTAKVTDFTHQSESYVVIDVETTGLSAEKNLIIEYGAVKVANGEITEEFSALVQREEPVPAVIGKLTGISDDMLTELGVPPEEALEKFLAFVGNSKVVGHNISFDMEFLRVECQRYGKQALANKCQDILKLARRRLTEVANYKLDTLAEYFGLDKQQHRALSDCVLAQKIYGKLMEK